MQQDQRAEELVRRYADPILRLSYAYLKNTHDAQDVCQTVFVKLLTEPRDFESPEHEKAYVLRMAANACKDLLRSPWRKRVCGLDTVLVLSGVTDRSMIDHFPYRPRLVLQGVGDIPDASEEGIVHLESAVG